MQSDDLARFSDGFAALAASGAPLVVGLRAARGRPGSGVLWRDGVVVTSEQALPEAADYTALLPGGGEARAELAGRDRGTNVAVLRVEAKAPMPERADPPGPGVLALALGTDGAGGCTVRMAMIHRIGPAWHSMAGGRIDHLVRLDARLSGSEEGGPVLDARGRLLGMSTLGPRRRALLIPHETVERVLDPLLAQGRVARGWLGVALQPVTLPEALRAVAGCESGLMVMSLSTSGPAEVAGVLPGDIMLEVDGARSVRLRELAERLGPERVGTECAVRLLRAGAVVEVRVTIGARP
ncbi:MAG TPA: S1C family serine protease [Acetobacteraceae bacterium]|nr:S1C family serine protease [Acetobacteraceae bacterium]